MITGIAVIDEQHRVFVEMIAELGERIENGQERQGLLDALQGMTAYAAFHFTDEEALMRQAGYVDLPAHRKLHAHFLSRCEALDLTSGTARRPAALAALGYLMAWLLGHIKVEDMAFAKRHAVALAG